MLFPDSDIYIYIESWIRSKFASMGALIWADAYIYLFASIIDRIYLDGFEPRAMPVAVSQPLYTSLLAVAGILHRILIYLNCLFDQEVCSDKRDEDEYNKDAHWFIDFVWNLKSKIPVFLHLGSLIGTISRSRL